MPYSRGKVGFSFGGKCTGRVLVAAPYSTASLDRWTKECAKLKRMCWLHPGVPALPACFCDIPTPRGTVCVREGKKKIPTMSVLPLGILPLGGHRGCLPSLPGHSTLREPKTRKVLTNPAAQWGRAKTKKQSTQERYTHTGPPSTPPKVHCSWPTAQNWLLVSWVSRQTESLWKLMKYTLPLSCSCNTLQRQRFRP